MSLAELERALQSELLNVRQSAELGVSPRTLARYAREGRIRIVRTPWGQPLYSRADVLNLVNVLDATRPGRFRPHRAGRSNGGDRRSAAARAARAGRPANPAEAHA